MAVGQRSSHASFGILPMSVMGWCEKTTVSAFEVCRALSLGLFTGCGNSVSDSGLSQRWYLRSSQRWASGPADP